MLSSSPYAPRIKRILFAAVAKRIHPLSFVCFMVGLVWFLMWPVLSHKRYISENALGVGQYYLKFGEDDLRWAAEQMRSSVETKSQQQILSQMSRSLHSIGLETRLHNFKVERHYVNETRIVRGTNLYGTLRAPKGSGKESIVLRSGYIADAKRQENLVLGLAMMRMFARQKWLHHDLIFVVADKGERQWAGDEAFVTSKEIRTGNIREAVILDFDSFAFDSISILTEGINGELPNLDLVNAVTKLCQYQGLTKVSLFKSDLSIPEKLPYSVYLYYKLLRFVQRQVKAFIPDRQISEHHFEKSVNIIQNIHNQMLGVPTGAHGWYRKFSIHSVTLTNTVEDTSMVETHRVRFQNMMAVGKVCEGTVRSMNNLIEELHHSFFIYFLDSADTFYGFEDFLPNLLVLIGPLVLQFVGNYYVSEQQQLVHSLAYFGVTALTGGIIYVLPYGLQSVLVSTGLKVPADTFLLVWGSCSMLVIFMLFGVVYPLIDRLYLSLFASAALNRGEIAVEWRTVKAFTMSYCCIVLGVMFVLESASCILASVYLYILAVIIASSETKGITKRLQQLSLLLLSPFTICSLLAIGYIQHHSLTVQAFLHKVQVTLSREMIDIYNNSAYISLCVLYIPVWLMCFKLASLNLGQIRKEKED